MYMINLKCANNFIVVFNGSTSLRMRAQYSYLSQRLSHAPHGYDDGTPGRLSGDTTLLSAVARGTI